MKSSPSPLFDTLGNLREQKLTISLSDFAKVDMQHAKDFLYSYRGSEATFNAYRREIERLLQWSWYLKKKSIVDLTRHEIEEFIEFCQNPPLTWIGIKNVARYIDREGSRVANPEWRPFVVSSKQSIPDPKAYSMSQKAVQAIFSVLSTFFNYLIQEEYCQSNPIALIRQKSKYLRKHQGKQIIRRLSELQWSYVIETAQLMATENPVQHERTLFIMTALYGMYLRVSELAASSRWMPKMGDFQKDHDGHWWFLTVGKGNKERHVSVSDAMLDALKRYRVWLRLTPLPAPAEQIPLISRTKGKGPVSSTRLIRMIVQKCFDRSIQRLAEDGFSEESHALNAATVHWLRHTGISDDVKHRPREHVRDDAGHGSSAITDKYIDIEMRERHASARNKIVNPSS